MQKWEYYVLPLEGMQASIEIGQELNRCGSVGWELVAVNGNSAIFKRLVIGRVL
jgi:hypothetical protein